MIECAGHCDKLYHRPAIMGYMMMRGMTGRGVVRNDPVWLKGKGEWMDGLDGWMMYMARGTKWMDFAPGFTYFLDRSRRHLSVFAVLWPRGSEL